MLKCFDCGRNFYSTGEIPEFCPDCGGENIMTYDEYFMEEPYFENEQEEEVEESEEEEND